MPKKMYQKLIWLVLFLFVLSATTACQSESSGPGMILSFGSVIDARSIAIKSAKLPNGHAFSSPGALGGRFDKTRETWKHGGVGSTMGASGDYRGLPEWVDFEWSEPPYPEDKTMSLEAYRALPRKTHRLEIKSRIPEEVVNEVIESNRKTPKGQRPEKTLWLYIFWTPDGMKMRWELKYDKNHKEGGFGHSITEGGDDLDRYNQ